MSARFISTASDLQDVAAALATAPWVAVDSESNSMFVYREQVCLLQLNAGGALFVIDPLALGVTAAGTPSSALDLLKPGLERTDRPLWVHGGEYDVAVLRRDFNIALGGVFDTQQAASLLGHVKTGYGSLAEAVCGVVLAKSFATYDWATRPLDPAALAYAIDDVVYLPRIADEMVRAVAAAGIGDEVAMANRAVAAQTWTAGFDPERVWRMKEIDALDGDALRTVVRLYAWRDEAARQENAPPARMMNDEVVKWLARHRPRSIAALSAARIKPGILARHGATLVDAIVAAAGDALPVRATVPRLPQAVMAREERLKAWRRKEAEARSLKDERVIPLQLVLPARALEHLKVHGAVDLEGVPQLGPARIARYGETLKALCA